MRYYIQTYGCQMNVYDSRQMNLLLQAAGHDPAGSPQDADILLLNTCAVRDSAERRVWGELGRCKRLKEQGRCRILALCGCMAQNYGEEVFRRAPHVDLVLGTGALAALPRLIQEVLSGQSRPLDVDFYEDSVFFAAPLEAQGRIVCSRAGGPRYPVFVSVMRGCNYRCTYCVVPRVRGPEVCRPPHDIGAEVGSLVEAGCREVTLIGQTVNSYRYDSLDFADLLRQVASTPGLHRVRFMTSHPRDFSHKLIDTIAEEPKVCEHVHLPAQSGSDRILRRMGRRYTASQYRDLAECIRSRIPGVSLTTDLMVGFPGELEQDFEATLDLMRQVRWEGGFLFKYSERPGTAATRLQDCVPEPVMNERFQRALTLQLELANEANRRLLGRTVDVLLEEVPRLEATGVLWGEYKGRTRANTMVIVHPSPKEQKPRYQVSDLVQVRVTQARAYTLVGEFAVPAEG